MSIYKVGLLFKMWYNYNIKNNLKFKTKVYGK